MDKLYWRNNVQKHSSGSLYIINEMDGIQQLPNIDRRRKSIVERYAPKLSTQIFTAFVANLSAFSFGCVWSWTATALPSIDSEVPFGVKLVDSEEAWITSIVHLGSLVASPLTGFLLDKFGSRKSLLTLNPGLMMGWLIIAFAQNVPMMYAGRFVTGLCAGGLAILSPIFVSEIAHEDIRGVLVCMFDPALALGMLYIYIIGSFTSWTTQAFVCLAIPTIAVILLFLIPESPRYLLLNGKCSDAELALYWYRPGYNIQGILQEFIEIRTAIEARQNEPKEERFKIKEWFQMNVVKPTLIATALMFFHMASGNYAILAYTVDIFRNAGVDDPYLSTILVGVAQLLGSCVTLLIVEKYGRRCLLLFSQSIIGSCLIGLGLFFFIRKQQIVDGGGDGGFSDEFDWVPLTLFMIYEIAFSIGLGPIPYLLVGEILPPNAKGISSCLIFSTESIVGFLVLHQFTNLMDLFGKAIGYWFLAFICLIGIIFSFTFVPETKGKSLEEINALFVRKSSIVSSRL